MRLVRGFTLIELLVALAIFGVLAALSLQAISSAAEQRTFVETEGRKWRELDRLFAAIESDLGAAVAGDATFIGRGAAGSDRPWIDLVRAGRSQADDVPLPPQAIAYRLIEGRLARTAGAERSDAGGITVRYASEIAGIRARYLSSRGEWQPQWQSNDGSLPRAVEIVLQLPDGADVRRVVLVR